MCDMMWLGLIRSVKALFSVQNNQHTVFMVLCVLSVSELIFAFEMCYYICEYCYTCSVCTMMVILQVNSSFNFVVTDILPLSLTSILKVCAKFLFSAENPKSPIMHKRQQNSSFLLLDFQVFFNTITICKSITAPSASSGYKMIICVFKLFLRFKGIHSACQLSLWLPEETSHTDEHHYLRLQPFEARAAMIYQRDCYSLLV